MGGCAVGRGDFGVGIRCELIYLTNDRRAVATPVRTMPSLELGTSRTLFAIPKREAWSDVAVSADGQRFLSISSDSRGSEQPVTIVLNWPAEIARR
jgi:hypothetical protein